MLDSADSDGSLNSGDVDVSTNSPAGSPGVSDDVVILGSGSAPSDGGDGVIEVGSASGGVEDSTGVSLESKSVGLNGDRDWSEGDGILEGLSGSGLNVVVSFGGGDSSD